MRKECLTLALALACGTPVSMAFAQQGAGQGSNRNGAAGGVSVGAGLARGQGALRSLNENRAGGASLGAQFNASGTASAGGIATSVDAKTRGRANADARGVTLHDRARLEMAARLRERENRPPESKPEPARTRGSKSTAENSSESTTTNETPTPSGERGTRAPWVRSGVSRTDWLLAKRLASIDHMRDVAIENGNERMLAQADKLEAVARHQHELRTGEFAETSTTSETTTGSTPAEPSTPPAETTTPSGASPTTTP